MGTNGMYKGAGTTVFTVVLFLIVKDLNRNQNTHQQGICKETMDLTLPFEPYMGQVY